MSDTEQQMQTQAETYRQLHRRDQEIADLKHQRDNWQLVCFGLGVVIVALLTTLVWG